jgi:hypothetical protein
MGIEFVFWYWWVIAAVFLGVEMLTTTFFFLWIAIAAAVTGALSFIMPALGFNVQLFIFAVLGVASVVVWKHYMLKNSVESDHPHLNQRGAQYVGKNFILIEAIENGRGRIKVADSTWRVEADEDCPEGATVKIIAVNGTMFKVIRVN